MKYLYLLVLTFCCIQFNTAQSIDDLLKDLNSALQTVKTEKDTYEQSIEQGQDNPCKLIASVTTTDHKGRTSMQTFEFYWSDLEENAVRYEVKRDVIYVIFSTGNNQPLIKSFEDRELDGYQRDGQLIAADSENAKTLVELLKKGITACKERPKSDPPPSAYEPLIEWINERISQIKPGDEYYEQRFEIDETHPNRLNYLRTYTDRKNRKTDSRFNFNPADLNERKISFEVRNEEIEITLYGPDRMKLMSSFENGEFDRLTDEFTLYLDDVAVARNIIIGLEKLIQLGEERLASSLPDVSTLSQIASVLNESVGDFNREDENYKQTITFDKECWVDYTKEIKSNETVTHDYRLNLSYIDPASLDFDISGRNEIEIEIRTNQDPMIQHLENGIIQRYEKDVVIAFADFENARKAIHALRAALPLCREIEMPAYGFDWIKNNTGEVVIEEDKYFQDLKTEDGQCNLELTVNGPKDKFIYEFLVEDLNPRAVEVEVSGNEMFIVLSTNRNEKLIKTFENGEPSDYQNELKIRVPGPEIALIGKASWEKLISSCQ